MELISGIVIGAAIAIILGAIYQRRRRPVLGEAPTPAEIMESALRDLSDMQTRRDLTAFLKTQQVVGDADIREGEVYEPVPATRLDPLAMRLRNAHSVITRLRNRNACSLYILGSDDERPRALDLDLMDIGEAASVMERVAADRRKSRALYRGMTDEEVTKFVRAGMSAFFKDDGEWGKAHEAMGGLLDKTPEFHCAREALELAFKVKAANA